MIQEGVRFASDTELEAGMKNLMLHANAHTIHSPERKAAARWMSAIIDEMNRRYPAEPDWQGDPGDEMEV